MIDTICGSPNGPIPGSKLFMNRLFVIKILQNICNYFYNFFVNHFFASSGFEKYSGMVI